MSSPEHPIRWRAGVLTVDDVPVPAIAEAAGTPTYVYSATAIRAAYQRLATAFAPLGARFHYAIKASPNLHLCRLLRSLGAGMDVVSGGEMERAWLAGTPMSDIVFAGVGKSDAEIRAALDGRFSPMRDDAARFGAPDPAGRGPVGVLNVESESELQSIARLARELGVVARLCVRVNPNVDPHTHEYTTTGKEENKFGIDADRIVALFDAHAGERVDRARRAPPPHRLAGAEGRALRRGDRGGVHAHRRARGARPRDPHPRSRRRLAGALPRRRGAADRGLRRAAGAAARAADPPRAPGVPRARAFAARQLGDPGHARRAPQARARQDLRDLRRRHARPHPPRALPRLPLRLAGGVERPAAALQSRTPASTGSSRSTWSVRSARRATSSRARAGCRPSSAAICSPCSRPAPTACRWPRTTTTTAARPRCWWTAIGCSRSTNGRRWRS